MKKSGGINIGTSSILVIFVLLALVTFAALSYLSAKSDYTLSKEAADRTASYYDANRVAELYLANIDGVLTKHSKACDNKEQYYSEIEKLFSDNENVVVENLDGRVILSFTVAVTKGQNLDVELAVHYPDENDTRVYYIDKWATSTNQEWLDEVRNGNLKDSGVRLLF